MSERSSTSVVYWKRFHNGFGRILASQIAFQRRSLRRPRGLQKRLFSNLASHNASRMDSGRYLHPLRLDFQGFCKVMLVENLALVCLSLQFYIRSHSRHLSCSLRHPWPKSRLVLFSHFQFRCAMTRLAGLANGTPSAAILDPNWACPVSRGNPIHWFGR